MPDQNDLQQWLRQLQKRAGQPGGGAPSHTPPPAREDRDAPEVDDYTRKLRARRAALQEERQRRESERKAKREALRQERTQSRQAEQQRRRREAEEFEGRRRREAAERREKTRRGLSAQQEELARRKRQLARAQEERRKRRAEREHAREEVSAPPETPSPAAPTPAAREAPVASKAGLRDLQSLRHDSRSLRRAIVLSEVLGPPKALRESLGPDLQGF